MRSTTIVSKIDIAFLELLESSNWEDFQWLFSSEADVQAHLFRIAFSTCSDLLSSREAWLGMEAQPRWFLHDLGAEFFKAFGFQGSLKSVRQIMRSALEAGGYQKATARFDIALLMKCTTGKPHLHLWEIKFFSLSNSLSKALSLCISDAQRISDFKHHLATIMQLTGEVVWVDPYSTPTQPTINRLITSITRWNQSNSGIPVRFWTFNRSGNSVQEGFNVETCIA